VNFQSVSRVLLSLFLVFALTACSSSNSTTQSNPIEEVGFDLDDTLVFSTPGFERAYKMAKKKDFKPFSEEFWSIVNNSDASLSCIKTSVVDILEKHQKQGREIYVVTAREPHNTEPAREFVHNQFDIPKDHLFFEPNGKTERLKKLEVDIYYGDSDSDISDAQKANIKAIRIQRNPKSDYQKKYHPGKYGEKILQNSTSHTCK
jgi:acid phosphatase (class B)